MAGGSEQSNLPPCPPTPSQSTAPAGNTPGSAKTSCKKCIKTDFVIVIGTNNDETTNWKTIIRSYLNRNPLYGNKMMFFGYGLHAAKQGAGTDYTTVICFTGGYSYAQTNAAFQAFSGVISPHRFFEVNSISEMFARINAPSFATDSCERKIKRLEFYAHGLESTIEFGLGSHAEANPDMALTIGKVSQFNADRFDKGGSIASYACRTGNSHNTASKNSLAQKMAEATHVPVTAAIRRTDYGTNLWRPGVTSTIGEPPVVWDPHGSQGQITVAPTPTAAPDGFWKFEAGKDPVRQ